MAQSAALLTNLLNTLHSHLQSQTQLLPAIHVQLGLPPTALEDDLNALQQNLMQSVESQIESRRKEVEDWLEKCDGVEAECVKYSKALGGNIKATGTSIGELRKENMLPRRFEMVTEYQERLRQLYHTKLEQLMTLTGKLNHLVRTVGPTFFAPDVLDPTPASVDNQNRDVTPERFLKLEKELVRGKAELSKRLQQLSTTFIQIDWLYSELGMTPVTPASIPMSLPSTSSLSIPSTSFARATSPMLDAFSDPFVVTSTPTPVSRFPTSSSGDDDSENHHQRIFARFVAKVEEAAAEGLSETSSIPVGLDGVDPTQNLIAWANKTCASLEEVKRRRESHIQAMYDQLEALWKRLGVHEEDMDAFVEEHRGSTEDVVKEYEDELERMIELKRERMSVFVENAREEIVKLWDELLIGEDERSDFAPFADDEHTEELLCIHEDEIRRLKEEKRMKAPLLAGIKKYFEICEEQKELASAANDQSRLTGRGARDPGRLLREEKMRKRVQKEKPRLEQDLLAALPAWEAEAGRPFLVNGESILQILMETASANDQENSSRKRGSRAGSVPPRSTTPSNTYAPAKTGVVTPAIRPSASSSHSMPNKRAKLNESTTTFAPRAQPLGASRNGNRPNPRNVSPSKIPGSRSKARVGSSNDGMSSLPRPTSSIPHIAMPIPKPGTQHHALGHGRVPTSGVFSFGASSSSSRPPSATNTFASSTMRQISSGAGAAKKIGGKSRRESFKPRPSVDMDMAASTRWAGFASSVKEEEEVY